MAMTNTVDVHLNVIATCENHTTGNGRDCEWCCDSEYYATDTLKGAVTIKGD